MRFALVLLPVLVLACSPVAEAPAPGGYHVDGTLRAPTGEAIFLRSINAHGDSKWAEGNLVPLERSDLDRIHEGGFNSVRFLTFWSAVEPEEGRFDDDYLARLKAEVQKISDDDLYLVIDMHQDVWGAPYGNGAPAWACDHQPGFVPDSPWWVNYFAPQVSACFDALWLDEAKQDQLIAAWVQVAERVCDVEGVVGFDLLNEPWPGSNLGEREFDQILLYEGYYRRAMDAIEGVCPGKVFFLEPSRAYDFGLVDPIELLDEDRDRVVLAPHFYPIDVHEPGRTWGASKDELAEMYDHLYAPWLDAGVPLWMGEVGGITSNPGYGRFLEDLHALLAARGVGHSIWAFSEGEGYDFLDLEGEPHAAFAAVSARPVPTLLPSWPVEMKNDASGLTIDGVCLPGRRVEVRLPRGGAIEVEGALSEELVCESTGPYRLIVANQ